MGPISGIAVASLDNFAKQAVAERTTVNLIKRTVIVFVVSPGAKVRVPEAAA